MKPSVTTLVAATLAITMTSLLLLPATAAATRTAATVEQSSPRKLMSAANTAAVTQEHGTRSLLQQIDWGKSGPIYGGWCGLDHGGGPIIDAVDFCCFNHDNCYVTRGFGDCQCDLDIINCMTPLDTSCVGQENANLVKVTAIEYFSVVYNARCVPQAASALSIDYSTTDYGSDYNVTASDYSAGDYNVTASDYNVAAVDYNATP
jgi:hypothetical protein